MERSSEPTLPKILLSYEEFQRLKHIEVKYIELENQVQKDQVGAGQLKSEIRRLQDIEEQFKKLQEQLSVNQLGEGQNNDLSPPVPVPEKNRPDFINSHNPFDVTIEKDDENTKYDEKELLTFVPKNCYTKAKALLEKLEENPHIISWNSSGTLFIRANSIPHSDIFKLFPALFKKKSRI